MRKVTITITGSSPYSASRYHGTEKLEKESPDAYERRTWPNKLHTRNGGDVVIPGVQLKKALEWTGSYLGETIPGKGKKTWTKYLTAATMPLTDIDLNVKAEDAQMVELRCDSQGRKGNAAQNQVTRCFPELAKWGGKIDFVVLDDTITADVFERYIREAGLYCGLGRWRPANGGMNGRFSAEFEWK